MASILQDIGKKEQKRLENPKRQEIIEAGRETFREYCNRINPDFWKPHREYQTILCNTMQAISEGKLINPDTEKPYTILVVNLGPGFGKSYSAILFETWFFGKNIRNQVISVSYNQDLANEMSKGVRDTINDEESMDPATGEFNFVANSFFPKLKIKKGDAAVQKWALEGMYKSYICAGFDGTITGMRGNLGVIDDPIKNDKEAVNDKVKAGHWNFYKNTFKSRMLDGAFQIIIQTRWATDDLAGKLLASYPEKCYELKMPAINEDGTSLCEDLYSIEDLLDKKETLDTHIFKANYMQEPVDLEGQLYQDFRVWDRLPDKAEMKLAYIDTADTGADYLTAIGADVSDLIGYVKDVYYSQEPMEITEQQVALFIIRNDIRICVIESNNGGRGFRRNVERILKEKYKWKKTTFIDLTQTQNKNTRILVNSSNVTSQLLFPPDWARRFEDYYDSMSKYQRKGKNAHDDAQDATTGLVECINGDVKVKKGKWGLSTRA